MSKVTVRFLGSGDAFGSGGRFNTCMLLSGGGGNLLIDCGASSMVALRRYEVDPNGIGTIVISHLHGDHFGGLPFFILDAQLVSRRTAPLVLAGPPGLRKRLGATMEALFPGSSRTKQRFELSYRVLEPGRPEHIDGVEVRPYLVRHACGAPPLALRIHCAGKTVAYSGDTEWCETLPAVAAGADLFIAEAYYFDKKVPNHLDFKTLAEHREEISARRVVLTHMSADMLKRVGKLGWDYAEDGKLLQV